MLAGIEPATRFRWALHLERVGTFPVRLQHQILGRCELSSSLDVLGGSRLYLRRVLEAGVPCVSRCFARYGALF